MRILYLALFIIFNWLIWFVGGTGEIKRREDGGIEYWERQLGFGWEAILGQGRNLV